jgi:hypothetical protein
MEAGKKVRDMRHRTDGRHTMEGRHRAEGRLQTVGRLRTVRMSLVDNKILCGHGVCTIH